MLGCLWILTSDRLADRLAPDEETHRIVQLYKGWFYVLLTAALVYWLIAMDRWKVRRAERSAERQRAGTLGRPVPQKNTGM